MTLESAVDKLKQEIGRLTRGRKQSEATDASALTVRLEDEDYLTTFQNLCPTPEALGQQLVQYGLRNLFSRGKKAKTPPPS